MAEQTGSPSLFVYVADPMCSWCYGFAPEVAELCARFPGVALHLVTGGLRAYNTEVMGTAMKDSLRHHWEEVQRASGQPFSRTLLERDDFVYDTEPACRAVVTVRENDPGLALPMLHATHRAFYADGLDVTRGEVLADVYATVCAAGGGSDFDPTAFYDAWASDTMRATTRKDFESTLEWGIRGFPTLLAIHADRAHVVAPGYVKAPQLIARASEILGA